MNEGSMVSAVYRELSQRVRRAESNLRTFQVESERSEVTGAFVVKTLAEAPLAVDGSAMGDLLFISDARKGAEGAGLGTGAPCYYNAATDTWKKISDDADVTV